MPLRIDRLLPGLLLCALLTGGCGLFGGDDDAVEIRREEVAAVPLTVGIHNHTIGLGGGRELLYTLAVPELTPGERVPLVVALHYAGIDRQHFAEGYLRALVEPGLRQLGAILFAPDVPGPSWVDPFSEDAVMAFVRQALEAWPVDPGRVVVTGYSMGGIGTWYLAEKYSRVFSAGIPMASSSYGSLKSQVAIYMIHGTEDELFDILFAERAFRELEAQGVTVEMGIGQGLSHYQVDAYVPLLQEVVPWLTETVWAP